MTKNELMHFEAFRAIYDGMCEEDKETFLSLVMNELGINN